MTRHRQHKALAYGDAPPPRSDGDKFTDARAIINEARFAARLPEDIERPSPAGTTKDRRRALARWLAEHGVPVPKFVPAVYGWDDCFTGQLANPAEEPGANGRTHS